MKTTIEYAPEFKSFSGRMFSIRFGSDAGLEVAKHGLGKAVVVSGVGSGPPFDNHAEYELIDAMNYVYGSTDREFVAFSKCCGCGRECKESVNTAVMVDQVPLGAIGRNSILKYVEMSGTVVMTRSIIGALEEANFTGFKCLPFFWRGPPEEDGRFGAIDVIGKTACGKLRLAGPNRCPHCEKGILMCPGCGNIMWTCSECGEATTRFHNVKGDAGRQVLMPTQPFPDTIIDPRGWDGSDLSHDHGFIAASPRLVKWLVERNVGPFSACPIRVGATGVDPDRLKLVAQLDADI